MGRPFVAPLPRNCSVAAGSSASSAKKAKPMNKKNLQQTLDGLANYSVELGEAVSSGPFFDAYVQNLTSPASLVPVLSGVLGK